MYKVFLPFLILLISCSSENETAVHKNENSLEEKSEVTTRFLHRKLKEYAEIEKEIELIKAEILKTLN